MSVQRSPTLSSPGVTPSAAIIDQNSALCPHGASASVRYGMNEGPGPGTVGNSKSNEPQWWPCEVTLPIDVSLPQSLGITHPDVQRRIDFSTTISSSAPNQSQYCSGPSNMPPKSVQSFDTLLHVWSPMFIETLLNTWSSPTFIEVVLNSW